MRLTFGYEHELTWLQCEIEWYILILDYMMAEQARRN